MADHGLMHHCQLPGSSSTQLEQLFITALDRSEELEIESHLLEAEEGLSLRLSN
jgi:hypothetical protein